MKNRIATVLILGALAASSLLAQRTVQQQPSSSSTTSESGYVTSPDGRTGILGGARETTIPGKQVMVANYTNHPPTIDGVFRPFEWRGAVPVYVDGTTPATAPGEVPNIPWLPNLRPPDSPEDSSFTIYTCMTTIICT